MNHTCTTHCHRIPADPTDRYHHLTRLKGLSIILITTHYAAEGTITHITRPDRTHKKPAPTVTIDNGNDTIVCEVHADDIIAPAAGE